jgi:hypothetical protein
MSGDGSAKQRPIWNIGNPSFPSLLGVAATLLGNLGLVVFRAVETLLEDGLGIVDLPLGLEVAGLVGHGAAVGPAPRLVEIEVLVNDLAAYASPVCKRSC